MKLILLGLLFISSLYAMEPELGLKKVTKTLALLEKNAFLKKDNPSKLTEKEVKTLYWQYQQELEKDTPNEELQRMRDYLIVKQSVDLAIKLKHLKNGYERASDKESKAQKLEEIAHCIADKILSMLTNIESTLTRNEEGGLQMNLSAIKSELKPYYDELLIDKELEKELDIFMDSLFTEALKQWHRSLQDKFSKEFHNIMFKEKLVMHFMELGSSLRDANKRLLAVMTLHLLTDNDQDINYSSITTERMCKELIFEAYSSLSLIPTQDALSIKQASYAKKAFEKIDDFILFLSWDEDDTETELTKLRSEYSILLKRLARAKKDEKKELKEAKSLLEVQIKFHEAELKALPGAKKRATIMKLGFAAVTDNEAILKELKPFLDMLSVEELREACSGAGHLYALFAYAQYCEKTKYYYPDRVIDALVLCTDVRVSLRARIMRALHFSCDKKEYKNAYNDLYELKENELFPFISRETQASIMLQVSIAELCCFELNKAIKSLSHLRHLVKDPGFKQRSAGIQLMTYLRLGDASAVLRFLRTHKKLASPNDRVFFEMIALIGMRPTNENLLFELKQFEESELKGPFLYNRYYALYHFYHDEKYDEALEKNKICCTQKDDPVVAHLAWLDRFYMLIEQYNREVAPSLRAEAFECLHKVANWNFNLNAKAEAKTQLGLLALNGELNRKQKRKCLGYFDEVLELEHSNDFATIGALYGKTQLPQYKSEKLELLEKIITCSPEDNPAYYSRACLDLAEIYGGNREYGKALEIVQYPLNQSNDEDMRADAHALFNELLKSQG